MRQSGWDPSRLPSGICVARCEGVEQEQRASLGLNACAEDTSVISQHSDKMMASPIWKQSNRPLVLIIELSSMRSASEWARFEGGREEMMNIWPVPRNQREGRPGVNGISLSWETKGLRSQQQSFCPPISMGKRESCGNTTDHVPYVEMGQDCVCVWESHYWAGAYMAAYLNLGCALIADG